MSVYASAVYDVCCDSDGCDASFHTEADNALSARVEAGTQAGWKHTSRRIDAAALGARERGGRGSRQFDWCPDCFSKHTTTTTPETGA